MTIDGYTYPGQDKNRLCIGALPNTNSCESIDKVRKAICGGIQLNYVPGIEEVHLICKSQNSVYVQSRCYNSQTGIDIATVIKVRPGETMKIFDLGFFEKIINRTIPCGFKDIYTLTHFCTIRYYRCLELKKQKLN